MKTSIKILLLFVLFIFSNCTAQSKKDGKINTKINEEFVKSRKTFYGKLNADEYKQIRESIEKELKTEIPDNQSILINYYQYGTNCFEYGFSRVDAKIVIENSIETSKKISKEHYAIDFFVYSDDALNKEKLENNKIFKLDNGFFSQYIFTLKENCSAFFILKPNGNFMKYYGTDYYSFVEEFFKKK